MGVCGPGPGAADLSGLARTSASAAGGLSPGQPGVASAGGRGWAARVPCLPAAEPRRISRQSRNIAGEGTGMRGSWTQAPPHPAVPSKAEAAQTHGAQPQALFLEAATANSCREGLAVEELGDRRYSLVFITAEQQICHLWFSFQGNIEP